jgi:hypothetical protein
MKKKTIILIFTIFTVFSCKTKREIINGDLYFQIVDFTNFYGANKEQLEKLDKEVDSIRFSKMISENELELIEYYDKLKKHKLINYPSIRIKSDTIVRLIYITESEYEKVKDYKWSDLGTRKKKVKMKIEVQELDENIYFSDKIIDFKEIDGKSYWK